MIGNKENFQEIIKISDVKPVFAIYYNLSKKEDELSSNSLEIFEKISKKYENESNIMFVTINCRENENICNLKKNNNKYPAYFDIINSNPSLFKCGDVTYEELAAHIEKILEQSSKKNNFEENNAKTLKNNQIKDDRIYFNVNNKYFQHYDEEKEENKMKLHRKQVLDEKNREKMQRNAEKERKFVECSILFIFSLISVVSLCFYIREGVAKLD